MTDHDINRALSPIAGYKITRNGHEASELEMLFDDCGSLWLGGGMVLWSPATDSNHLREVLAKLTLDQATALDVKLHDLCEDDDPPNDLIWLLTRDPRIIAQAVAEVVK